MARDNDKGLYLPLRIDLSEWERDLAQADGDLQKTMRDMRSQVGNFKLKYDVEIAGAKAAGDSAKVLELENKKLNAVYDAQKRVVEQLSAAYKKSVQEKGADAKASQALARLLIKEANAMERTKAQLSSAGLNFGKNISDGLASISPAFANVRNATAGITSSLTSIGGSATAVATAVGGIGVALGGLAVGASALNKVSDYVSGIGKAAAEANDPIYQLREQLETTYKHAEKLQGVLMIDGVGVEQYSTVMNKLNKQLLNAGENGNLASDMLRRWHVEMRNGDGTRKEVLDQLAELAAGYKRAQKAGEGQDYLTATGTTSLAHVLNDLDGYVAKWKAIRVEYERNYQLSHDLEESENRLKLAMKQYDAIDKNNALESSYQIIQKEIESYVILGQISADNDKKLKEFYDTLGNVAVGWVEFKTTAKVALNQALMSMTDAIEKAEELKNNVSEVVGKFANLIGLPFEKIAGIVPQELKDFINENKKFTPFGSLVEGYQEFKARFADAKRTIEETREKMNERSNKPDTKKIDETGKEKPVDVAKIREEKKLQAERKKAQEQFYKELNDLQSTEYQREINRLNEKVEEWRKAEVNELDIAKRVAVEKEAIDKKYFDKLSSERDKQVKTAQDAYRKEAEEAKRAREASISEAESTLRNNLKLVRYIQQQQKQGTYNESDAKAYAERLYMRQSGFKVSDINALKDIGVNVVKEIANARDRLFGSFANVQMPQMTPANQVTNNNNVTVNFDNTVLDNVAAMDVLANKVADVILPTIERSLNGQAGGNTYGYQN